MPRETRVLAKSALVFATVMIVGVWPSSFTTQAWSHIMSAISNPLLSVPIGQGASARLEPLPQTASQADRDAVRADTALAISVEHYKGELTFGMTLRRDAYLPLVIFLALIAAAHVTRRRKLLALAIGVPLILLVGVVSIRVFATYVVAHQLPAIYPASDNWRAALDFIFERWLTPPGNRVIAPLLLAVFLVLAGDLQRRVGRSR